MLVIDWGKGFANIAGTSDHGALDNQQFGLGFHRLGFGNVDFVVVGVWCWTCCLSMIPCQTSISQLETSFANFAWTSVHGVKNC